MKYLETREAAQIAMIVEDAYESWGESQYRPTLDKFALTMVDRWGHRTLSRRMRRHIEALTEWRSTGRFPLTMQRRKAWEYAKLFKGSDARDRIVAYLSNSTATAGKVRWC